MPRPGRVLTRLEAVWASVAISLRGHEVGFGGGGDTLSAEVLG